MSDEEAIFKEMEYWHKVAGWAEERLTPDQLRELIEQREDKAAALRLRTYFFPDDLWKQLPERAQQALVSADRLTVTGTSLSRGEAVFNELRIATEEVLNRYLWQPVSEWAMEQPSPIRGTANILKQARDGEPSLDDLVQLLWSDGVKDYLRSIGVDDEGVRFLTKEKRMTDHLQRLQRSRNKAEHELDSAGNANPRDLYAESLGIGRKGVLPEILRLLNRHPERPDCNRILEGLDR